jgi:hypothetical protein
MSLCLVAAACGDVEGRKVQEGSGGSAGTSTGKGGTDSSGGSSQGGDSSGGSSQGGDSSGGSSQGGKGGSGGSEPMCDEGDLRCMDGDREECTKAGSWEPAATPCPVDEPICTGAGVCSAFRLFGTVDTFGPYPDSADKPYVLKRQTLLESQRVCNAAMTQCFRGGIYIGILK